MGAGKNADSEKVPSTMRRLSLMFTTLVGIAIGFPALSEVTGELTSGTLRVFYHEGGNLTLSLSGKVVPTGTVSACAVYERGTDSNQFSFPVAQALQSVNLDLPQLLRMATIEKLPRPAFNTESGTSLKLTDYLGVKALDAALAELGFKDIQWFDAQAGGIFVPPECDILLFDQQTFAKFSKGSVIRYKSYDYVELARFQANELEQRTLPEVNAIAARAKTYYANIQRILTPGSADYGLLSITSKEDHGVRWLDGNIVCSTEPFDADAFEILRLDNSEPMNLRRDLQANAPTSLETIFPNSKSGKCALFFGKQPDISTLFNALKNLASVDFMPIFMQPQALQDAIKKATAQRENQKRVADAAAEKERTDRVVQLKKQADSQVLHEQEVQRCRTDRACRAEREASTVAVLTCDLNGSAMLVSYCLASTSNAGDGELKIRVGATSTRYSKFDMLNRLMSPGIEIPLGPDFQLIIQNGGHNAILQLRILNGFGDQIYQNTADKFEMIRVSS